ncbi:hypothetical protein AMECASPLE_027867, partial [Ameca splendens]
IFESKVHEAFELFGIAVSRRGFLRPVSKKAHTSSSASALQQTHIYCHTTSRSSSSYLIAGSELCWDGH